MLNDISKEKRQEILENEFTHDEMHQPTLDKAWHEGLKIPGYIERIKGIQPKWLKDENSTKSIEFRAQ